MSYCSLFFFGKCLRLSNGLHSRGADFLIIVVLVLLIVVVALSDAADVELYGACVNFVRGGVVCFPGIDSFSTGPRVDQVVTILPCSRWRQVGASSSDVEGAATLYHPYHA